MPLLTRQQAAEYLTCEVKFIDKLFQKGLPHIRAGRYIRIRSEVLDQWLEEQTIVLVSERDNRRMYSVVAAPGPRPTPSRSGPNPLKDLMLELRELSRQNSGARPRRAKAA